MRMRVLSFITIALYNLSAVYRKGIGFAEVLKQRAFRATRGPLTALEESLDAKQKLKC